MTVKARVWLKIDGAIAMITLDRPEKLNAIDEAMLAELEAAVDWLEAKHEVRAVVLYGGGGRAFSVGADIDVWSTLHPLEMWSRWARVGHRVFDWLARLRQPVIAAINGYAFGGGLELALATDLRIAAAGAEMAMPEVKIGTVSGWAGTRRLPALIGAARAKRIVFTGGRVDAGTAERWGLVDEIASPGTLMQRAMSLAEEILANAPVSVQISKQLIAEPDGQEFGTALKALTGALAALTEDGREGLEAFRQLSSSSVRQRALGREGNAYRRTYLGGDDGRTNVRCTQTRRRTRPRFRSATSAAPRHEPPRLLSALHARRPLVP